MVGALSCSQPVTESDRFAMIPRLFEAVDHSQDVLGCAGLDATAGATTTSAHLVGSSRSRPVAVVESHSGTHQFGY